ncbi:proton-coupled amino acid transporter 3-like isoform X6 [Homalodisca vitripennis]|uniref:proton-coupled amino acid transporter 3-like isoform X6 n=1 Tax=Homalodisca vitripennis TaxID=197043 RepID=UPI001EECBDEE|nr:proton-coupled amino acid transporter 3-like isoform X6 [Homalodisca vitripennis]
MAQVKDDHKKNSFYLLEQGKPNDTSEDVENQPEEKGSDGHSLGVKHPTTYLESLFHLIKGNIGSGVFAMGDAFKNAGLLLAPVLTIFLGFVCIYGNHVLINCSKELGRRRKMRQYPTFPDTMEWSFQTGPKCFQRFSHTIRFLVSLFNIMAQLGFCSVYFVFISSTLHTVLPLQSEMKNPDKFGSRFGVLNVGMTIVGCALLWVGFVGYLKYGEDVAGSLTLNLPKNSLFSEVVQLTIAIGLLFSYALQFHVAVTFVWPDYNRKYGPFKHPVLAECGIRLGMALITFVAAEVVPKLGLFISLLGSVSSTALALVFPPLCDLALHWDTS